MSKTNETKPRVKIGEQTVKVALEPIYAFLNNESRAKQTIGTLVKSDEFIALLTAQRGGGSSDENWLTVNDQKIGRACAILDTFYPHNNDDKAVSHFYKNGSYHIVIEKLKNLKVKAHKAEQAKQLAKLEDDMMEGIITPKEWKAQKDTVLSEFKFEISANTKEYLVKLTKGYESKEALAEAMADENTDTNFTAIEDDVNKYLATVEAELFPTVEAEATETEATEEA